MNDPTVDTMPPTPGMEGGSGGSSSAAGAAGSAGEVRLRLFGRTDVGQVREHNEDNFLVADLTRRSRGLMEADRQHAVGARGTVVGVCDGMGGAAAGEVASQLAVDIIFESMLSGDPPRSRDDLARRLVRAVEAAGLRIYTEAKVDRARRGMGTTATIAALMDDHLFLAQVGDSRGYILREGKLVQVTRDQSLVNQLIEAGQLTEQEAETFEHNNIILQALGTADTVQVDLTYVHLRQGDTLMLCSDGLSGMIRFDDIREVLASTDEPLEACKALTDRANHAGGHDNITVIVAKFEGNALSPATPGDEELKYRKYALPEESSGEGGGSSSLTPRISSPPASLGGSGDPGLALPTAPEMGEPSRASDHGPSRSKVAHTMMGAQLDAAALAAFRTATPSPMPVEPLGDAWHEKPAPSNKEDLEPVLLPTSTAPAWMVGGVVGLAVVLALFAGYYLLR